MRAKSSPSFLVSQGPAILEKKTTIFWVSSTFSGNINSFHALMLCKKSVLLCVLLCWCVPVPSLWTHEPGVPAATRPAGHSVAQLQGHTSASKADGEGKEGVGVGG